MMLARVALAAVIAATTIAAPVFASPFASPRGYSMDMPAGWGVNAPGGDIDVFFVGPKYRPAPKVASVKGAPSLIVAVQPLKMGATDFETLAAARTGAETSLKAAYTGFAKTAEGDAALGALPGYFIEGAYDDKAAAARVTVRRVIGVGGRNVFTVTELALASDFEALRPTYEAAESSFALSQFNMDAYTSPYGFQITPPDGWAVHEEGAPDLVSFAAKGDDGQVDYSTTILIRARNGLAPAVDYQMVADNRAEWNAKYSEEPGYTLLEQGMILIGGEKAFYTVFTETDAASRKRLRKWHVLFPRNGVLVEIFASYSESDHRRYDRPVRDCLRSWIWCPPRPAAAGS